MTDTVEARVHPVRHGHDREAGVWREIDDAIEQAAKDVERLPPHYRQTLLPAGELVVVSLIDVEIGNVGGREKWFAHFSIVEGDHAGKVLLRAYNRPKPGWLSPQHALSRDFVAVTGLRHAPIPKRPPRAILGGFLRDVFVEARTQRVGRRMDRKTREWVETPGADHYSVIDEIVRLVAGTPRVCELRRKP